MKIIVVKKKNGNLKLHKPVRLKKIKSRLNTCFSGLFWKWCYFRSENKCHKPDGLDCKNTIYIKK